MNEKEIGKDKKSESLTAVTIDEKENINPGGQPLITPLAIKPLTSRQQNWRRGNNGEFHKENLPRGVCNTVYYTTKDGIRKHFTPGKAPRKLTINKEQKVKEAEPLVRQDDEEYHTL